MKNGFKMMSDSYREAAKKGQFDKKQAEKIGRVYDFLDTCDEEDLCIMFDSTAFNEIAKSYLRLAVEELINEDVIDEEQASAVRNRFKVLFDEKRASEV